VSVVDRWRFNRLLEMNLANANANHSVTILVPTTRCLAIHSDFAAD
jgi:hypothetical protein